MKRLLLVVVFALLVILPVKVWAQWEAGFVDTTGTVKKCDITVDTNGYPHISYRDGTIGWRLKYAHWDGSEWQIAFVETTESVYGMTSIALDGSGNPHIAFDKGIWYGEQLWHAWWDGANWQQEGIDSLPYDGNVGEWNSLAFDTVGYPNIAYTYYTNDGNCYLKHAYKDASGWHTQVADSLIGDEFKYISMALDNSNHPHISFYDWNVYDLKYAYWDGATWHIERVDTDGSVGTHSSIALDSLGCPHIAYTDGTNGGVKYARWDGSGWQIETVESDIGYGYYTSLSLDANDCPYISSAEYMGDLRFAYWDGSTWQIEVVDNTVGCDWTSLAIDGSGYCHIAYCNDVFDEYALKYAKRILTTGLEEITPHPIPEVIHLAQNYPNPFNPTTTFKYELPKESKVVLSIFDMNGRLVETIVNQTQSAGYYSVQWDASQFSSGVYIYRIQADQFQQVRKCVLIK